MALWEEIEIGNGKTRWDGFSAMIHAAVRGQTSDIA